MPPTHNYRMMYERVNLTGRIATSSARWVIKRNVSDMTRPHGGKLDAFCRTARVGASAGAFTAAASVVALPPCHIAFAACGTGVPFTQAESVMEPSFWRIATLAQYGLTGFVERGLVKGADCAEAHGRDALAKVLLGVAIAVRVGLQLPRAATATLAAVVIAAGALLGACIASGVWSYQQLQGHTVWLDDTIERSAPGCRNLLNSLNAAFTSADAVAALRNQSAKWPTAAQFEALTRSQKNQQQRGRALCKLLDGCKKRHESVDDAATRMQQNAQLLRSGSGILQVAGVDSARDAYTRLTARMFPGCRTQNDLRKAWRRASLLLHPDKIAGQRLDEPHQRLLVAVADVLNQIKEIACGECTSLQAMGPLLA